MLQSSGDVLSKVAETLCFMTPDKTNIEFLKLATRFFCELSRLCFGPTNLEELLLNQIVIERLVTALSLVNQAIAQTRGL